MTEVNPYQGPETNVASPQGEGAFTLDGPHKVTVGQALGWLGEGMRMLSGHWGVVIGALVLVMVITMGLQLIPFLGPLAQPFITTLLYAGLVKLFHRIATDGRSDFGDLFAGFSERTGPLLLLALVQIGVYLGALLVIGGLMAISMGGSMSLQSMDPQAMSSGMGVMMAIMLPLFLIVFTLVMFLFYFAVPLIMLGGMGLGGAMGVSFRACMKNLLPMIVYGIVVMLIIMVAALPLLLGLLFVMPILAGAYYVSFRQVLTNPADGAEHGPE